MRKFTLLLLLIFPGTVYMAYMAVMSGKTLGLAFQVFPVVLVLHAILSDFERMNLLTYTLLTSGTLGLMAGASVFDASRGVSDPSDWVLWAFVLLILSVGMLERLGVLRRVRKWLGRVAS